jgi:hypothetical protein
MSRASKITFACSTLFSAATIGAVYYMAEFEKDVRIHHYHYHYQYQYHHNHPPSDY